MKNDKWLDLTNEVCWSIIFSLAAIIMSIVALAHTHPRVLYPADDKTVVLGFDYIGVIVGILTLLVTLLVAWNIWQVIDTKNTVRKAEEASNKIRAFEEDMERSKNLHRPYLAYTEGIRKFDAKQYSSAICYFLEMAELYVEYEIELNSYMSNAVNNAISCIEKEPSKYKSKIFIERVDKMIDRLRKRYNAITPLEAQLSRIRKALEKLCEENVPNPYQIRQNQDIVDSDSK